MSLRPTRRTLAKLLAGWATVTSLPRSGVADPLDRGIGGTGAAPEPPPADRGIGGTGVIGTIRGFGSIVVNGQHIATPAEAMVTIDGGPARMADLKLGHVVKVRAMAGENGLIARTIAVGHEVVGRIQHASRHRIVMHRQTILVDDAFGHKDWRVGDRVAVSGLRRPDGVIVASLIEPADASPDRVVGTLERGVGSGLRIGPLTVSAARAGLVGRRAVVTGHGRGKRFLALNSHSELSEIAGLGADSYAIEAYVQRQGRSVLTGYGTAPGSLPGAGRLPDKGVVRAVLAVGITRGGLLQVNGVQPTGAAQPNEGPRRAPTAPGPAGQHRSPGPGTFGSHGVRHVGVPPSAGGAPPGGSPGGGPGPHAAGGGPPGAGGRGAP